MPTYYEEDEYRGKALIMCSRGTEVEMVALHYLAQTSGFNVVNGKIRTDMTIGEMEEMIRQTAKEDNKASCCFLCIILCRGDEGLLYDRHNECISLAKLMEPLLAHNCPELAGKPKIIIIDGVFGSKMGHDGPTDKPVIQYLPSDSDFFYMVSHLPRLDPEEEGQLGNSAFIEVLTHGSDNKYKNLPGLARELRVKLAKTKMDHADEEQKTFIRDKAYPYTISTLRYPFTLCKPKP